MPVTTRMVVDLGAERLEPAGRPRTAGREPARRRDRQRRRVAVGGLRRAVDPDGARPLPLWLRRADDQPRAAAALCQRAGAGAGMADEPELQAAASRTRSTACSTTSRRPAASACGGRARAICGSTPMSRDFLTRAREKGYEVPAQAMTQALSNLQNSLAYDIDLRGPRHRDRLCALRAGPQQEGLGRRPALLFRHAARGLLQPDGGGAACREPRALRRRRSARRRPSRRPSSLPSRRPSMTGTAPTTARSCATAQRCWRSPPKASRRRRWCRS